MTITERLFSILAKKGLSQKELGLYIGANEKTVSAWKKNNSLPPSDKLSDISDFLGISLELLVTGQEKCSSPELTENEQRMLQVFKNLTPTQQGELIGRASIMSEQNEAEVVKKDRVS